MNKEQLIVHVRNANLFSFQKKFEREMKRDLGNDAWMGYRLYLRGFSMEEIYSYIFGN